MICPVCKNGAIIVEYKKIELDYCPACRGVWFDAGELELLMESAGVERYQSLLNKLNRTPEAVSSEKVRKCPICRRKMKKAYIDEEGKVLVDVCHGGHGIWFDSGEVDHLLRSLAEKSMEKDAYRDVLAFVGEVFKSQTQ
jgi:hypothetical protein